MSNVISLPKREPAIWVCGCGCSTFKVYDDQHLECAQCGIIPSAQGQWVTAPVPETLSKPEHIEHVTTVSSAADWTLRKLLKGTVTPLALVLAIEESGKSTLWGSDCDTPERVAWLDRQFANARLMLTRQPATE
ncbi:hypothetical protein [Mesorhizobium sp. B2-6-7]|uniref:hypothetical protein n=1 Tax=Mesorhizobium sp. B2-6-7 TaxID=2589910 RepID=UPI00112E79B0|nr:hypothetical protein [Mesorhizobium sp. B2-6-7]TPJ70469.1 hypothetical protein FJ462_07170 [Mesorhizobium sp. B2-6-7]